MRRPQQLLLDAPPHAPHQPRRNSLAVAVDPSTLVLRCRRSHWSFQLCQPPPLVLSHRPHPFVLLALVCARNPSLWSSTKRQCAKKSIWSSPSRKNLVLMCWFTVSQSATTWFSTSLNFSTVSSQPPTAGSKATAPAVFVLQCCSETFPAQRQ